MFRSKIRPIIIPQYEHGRLAGTLAQHWGNEAFDRPALDFPAFVQGVAFHDWHYGFGDNFSIGDYDDVVWMQIAGRGAALRLDDPAADIVHKMHLRRLLTYASSLWRQALIEQIDQTIDSRLAETSLSRADFEWTDTITRFCDDISFYFSFGVPVERENSVGNRVAGDQKTAVTFQIKGQGDVLVDPWPFSVPFLSGQIIGYEADGYPDVLRPLVVPFRVSPST
jgi:hypothetical protein